MFDLTQYWSDEFYMSKIADENSSIVFDECDRWINNNIDNLILIYKQQKPNNTFEFFARNCFYVGFVNKKMQSICDEEIAQLIL